jgi:hypothetical protein
MDYWSRAPLSVSMRESLLREIEGFATRERKKSREIVELILEWSVARLQEAGPPVKHYSQARSGFFHPSRGPFSLL